MSVAQAARDPGAALASRPKLKKAPKKQRPPRAVTSTQEQERAEDDPAVDSLADQLNNVLDAGDAGSEPSAEPSGPSEAEGSSTRPRGGSLGAKLTSLGDDIKDALTPNGPRRHRRKERLAKRAAAAEGVREGARQEVARMGPSEDQAKVEDKAIRDACRELGVDMIEMKPDGHCLFSAIADQLNLHHAPATPFTPMGANASSNPFADPTARPLAGPHTFSSCRKSAAAYMRAHRADFLPYLPGEDDGGDGLMSEQEYARHCDLMEQTAEWGGEPEILALSRCFRYPIHVVQANSPQVKIGDDDFLEAQHGRSLLISYHRASYGLGEHYNSLRPRASASGTGL